MITKKKLIHVSENTVVIADNEPENPGSDIDFKIDFPDGAVIDDLELSGKVIDCKEADVNGETKYVYEIRVGNISKTNKDILRAYSDYLVTDEKLNLINMDFDFSHLDTALEKLTTELRNLTDTAHSLLTKADDKKTLH